MPVINRSADNPASSAGTGLNMNSTTIHSRASHQGHAALNLFPEYLDRSRDAWLTPGGETEQKGYSTFLMGISV